MEGFKPRTRDHPGVTVKSVLYDRLPEPLKPLAKRGYYTLVTGRTGGALHSEFVAEFFGSRHEYERYVSEFERGRVERLRNDALAEYRKLTGRERLSGVDLDTARDYYALTRVLSPSTVVETGVCNGVSTLAVLLALRENETGTLHSIDYPLVADESLEEFRDETFAEYGGAAIPSDKEPGWIVPDELRSRWELTIGKSQRELPRLVAELGTVDLFFHDSEHSHPCMMFEFELVYEWLADRGVIVADDVTWNDAFSVFTEVRSSNDGRLSHNVGYVRRTE